MRWPIRPKPKAPSPSAPPSSPPGPAHSPADLPETFEAGRKVKKEEIRALAELVRKRYGLDLEIWSLREAPDRDRPQVRDKMRRADAALVKIRATVRSWDRRDVFEETGDWEKFLEIKWRLMGGEKRVWGNRPPWVDRDV